MSEDPTAGLIEDATELPFRRDAGGSCESGISGTFIKGFVVLRDQTDLERHCGDGRYIAYNARLPEVDFQREVALYVGAMFSSGGIAYDILDVWQRPGETLVRVQSRVWRVCENCSDNLSANIDLGIIARPSTPIRFVTIPPQ